MPKILVSPGYGAGWVSWHGTDDPAEKMFMLAYRPLVEAIENATPEQLANRTHYLGLTGLSDPVPGSVLARFVKDWIDRFGGDNIPYLGGARDLEVVEIEAGVAFLIDEYDGFESISYRDMTGWFVLGEDAIEGTVAERGPAARELPSGQ